MILASLEIYSLWLYGHSKQHCRSSQVLSLVHSVVYILVELIIYYVSLNILFKRFLPEKVCIVLRELFHEETNSSCWWYIRWHSPVLWCWQQIYIIRILLFCLLSSRRQSILTCLIYRANIIPQDFTMETSYFLLLIKKSGHIDWLYSIDSHYFLIWHRRAICIIQLILYSLFLIKKSEYIV